VTQGWRKLHSSSNSQDDQINDDATDRTRSTHGIDEKLAQNFGWKSWWEDTNQKTQAQIERQY
jgi:hypothetical protein